MEEHNKNMEEQVPPTENISRIEIIIDNKKSKKRRKIWLIIVCVLVVLGIGIGVLNWWKRSHSATNPVKAEPFMVFVESLNVVRMPSLEDADVETFVGEDGVEFEDLSKPVEIVKTLPYGTKVEIDLNDFQRLNGKYYYKLLSSGENEAVYTYDKNDDYYLEAIRHDPNYITGGSLSGDEEYKEELLLTFPVKEAQRLPVAVKLAIVDYLNDNDLFGEYGFTQDPNRIKKAIVLADLNMDGAQDAAIVLEDKYKNNRLFVFCYNKDLETYYVAHKESSGYPAAINFFKKNAKIFIDSENLVNAPGNGIIYQMLGNTDIKYAIFYNSKTMQFEQYFQQPLSKQYEGEYEEEFSEGEEYVEDTVQSGTETAN
jgi:hypothetical protein